MGEYLQARSCFEKACYLNPGVGNEGIGCLNLGTLYYNGHGVSRDLSQARTYYKKSCELSNPDGCLNLGVLYINGQGGRPSRDYAEWYFKEACKFGSQDGCNYHRSLEQARIQVSHERENQRRQIELQERWLQEMNRPRTTQCRRDFIGNVNCTSW